MRIRSLALLLLLTAAGVSASFTDSSAARRRRRDRPVPVRVMQASMGRIGRGVRATGTLYPASEVKLMARMEGQVKEVRVREGSRVRKGQLLAKLDSTIHRIEIALAQSELAAVRARLKKLRAGYLPQEIAAAEADVAQTRAVLERSEAELASADARLKEAAANAKSLRAMFRRGVISRREWIKTSTEANRARAEVAERRGRLAEARARIRAAEALLKLKRMGSRPEDIEAARAEEQKALQRVHLLKARLEYFSIRSPISGVITERKIEPGDLAVNRAHLLSIVDDRTLRLRSRVSELDLPRLRPGQAVAVEVDAFPERKFRGTLSLIFPQVDPRSRQVIVEVNLPNPRHLLRPGLLARVRFDPLRGERTIVLPAHAVEWEEGNEKAGHVFVLKPLPPRKKEGVKAGRKRASPNPGEAAAAERGRQGEIKRTRARRFRAERRRVTLGLSVDGRVQVLKGLQAGERVIVSGIGRLRDGRAVRVVRE